MSEPDPTLIIEQETAKRLLGNTQYQYYLDWQLRIADESQIPLYGGRSNWEYVRDRALAGYGIGCIPEKETYRILRRSLMSIGVLYARNKPPKASLPVAPLCGHTLHPGNPGVLLRAACPVCTMGELVQTLERIWNLLNALKAPSDRYLYDKVKPIWAVEKCRWANVYEMCDEGAKWEARWEEEKLATSSYTCEDLKTAQSCITAVQLSAKCPSEYWEGADVPSKRTTQAINARRPLEATRTLSNSTSLRGYVEEQETRILPTVAPTDKASKRRDSVTSPPSPRLGNSPPSGLSKSPSVESDRSPRLAKKRVSFATDILEYEKRLISEFSRKCANYKQGRYACPSEAGWEDTSGRYKAFDSFYNEEQKPKNEEAEKVVAAYRFLKEQLNLARKSSKERTKAYNDLVEWIEDSLEDEVGDGTNGKPKIKSVSSADLESERYSGDSQELSASQDTGGSASLSARHLEQHDDSAGKNTEPRIQPNSLPNTEDKEFDILEPEQAKVASEPHSPPSYTVPSKPETSVDKTVPDMQAKAVLRTGQECGSQEPAGAGKLGRSSQRSPGDKAPSSGEEPEMKRQRQ